MILASEKSEIKFLAGFSFWWRVSSWFTNSCAVLSRLVVSDSLRPHGLQPARLLYPWNSPGKNTVVGCLSLLQGIFPTQGSNPGLLRCRRILYCLSHPEGPRILVWVAYPFSGGASWPMNQTEVSCIASKFFPSWATWKALADGRSLFYYPQ